LKLFTKIIALGTENNNKHVEKAEFSNVTASGSYNYHRAEKFILRIHVLIRMKCERKVSWLAWFTLEGFESDLMKHEVHLAQCIEKLNW